MTKTADEIVVGANGSIFVAPVGSTLPGTLSDELDAAFVELGYVTEDGVTWTDGKSLNPIRAWQSFYDLRRVVESREGSAAFSLQQWNADTTKLAFGGGDVTEDDPGEYRYTPPSPEDIDERMLAIEWQDGTKNYRLILTKGMVSDNVETNITRTDAMVLPITFSILGEADTDPWILQTDDPAFAAGVGS